MNAVGGEHGRPGAGIQRGLAARRQQERARRSRRRRGARVHDAGSLRVRGATPLCTRPHCKTGCSAATLPRPMPVRRPAGSRLTGPPHRRRRGSRALAVAAARFPVSPNPPPLDRARPRTARPPSRWRRRRAPRATHPSRGSCQKPRPSPYRRRVCCTYPLAGCAWSAAPHERGGRGGGAEGEGGRPSVPAGRGRRCAGAAAPLSILPQRGGAPLPTRLSGARVRGGSASAPPRARGGRGVGSACAAAAAARLAPPQRQRRAAAIVPAARRRPIGWRRPAAAANRVAPPRAGRFLPTSAPRPQQGLPLPRVHDGKTSEPRRRCAPGGRGGPPPRLLEPGHASGGAPSVPAARPPWAAAHPPRALRRAGRPAVAVRWVMSPCCFVHSVAGRGRGRAAAASPRRLGRRRPSPPPSPPGVAHHTSVACRMGGGGGGGGCDCPASSPPCPHTARPPRAPYGKTACTPAQGRRTPAGLPLCAIRGLLHQGVPSLRGGCEAHSSVFPHPRSGAPSQRRLCVLPCPSSGGLTGWHLAVRPIKRRPGSCPRPPVHPPPPPFPNNTLSPAPPTAPPVRLTVWQHRLSAPCFLCSRGRRSPSAVVRRPVGAGLGSSKQAPAAPPDGRPAGDSRPGARRVDHQTGTAPPPSWRWPPQGVPARGPNGCCACCRCW